MNTTTSVSTALIKAFHPLPAAAVTVIVTATGWSLGWRNSQLALLALVVFVGQLSVGWSNDAHDGPADIRANRLDKPVVRGEVTTRLLWTLAGITLTLSVIGSWWVAGWVGGSFHIAFLASAWMYNLGLSRTNFSWVPYAIAFGSIPAFLSFGLNDTAPEIWMTLVFAIIGVSAHLANALPDLETDHRAGLGGIATRLGAEATVTLCWVLLAIGSGILAVQGASYSPVFPVIVIFGYLAGLAASRLFAKSIPLFVLVLLVLLFDLIALLILGVQVST